jgi:signal transduction histidine kinase/ligand-binding sensor domain-containing protein
MKPDLTQKNIYRIHFQIKFKTIIPLPVVLFSFFILNQVYGQPKSKTASLFVSSYGIEEGLRQSMVRQVCQDSRGLIWMVTGDGLQCFDGQEFRLFRVPLKGQESYSENIMREMVESAPGQFTISTSSSILNFNSTTGDFKVVFRKPGNHPRVFNLLSRQKPLAWITGKGLCLIDADRLKPFLLNYSENNKPPDDFYPQQAVESRFGTILLENERGYLEINIPKTSADSSFNAHWVPLADGCQGLAKDVHGNIFVLSGRKIFYYQQSGLLKEYFDTKLTKLSYLSIDRNQNFWIADRLNKKVYRLNGKDFKEIKMLAREGKHADTLNPIIISLNEDKHGNLWFGTDGDGVLLFSPGLTQFARAKTGFTRCLAYLNGEIWTGTFRNGLWRLSPDLSEAIRIAPRTLPDDLYFLDLAADKRGRIWAATDKGIYVMDSHGRIVARYADNFATASFLNVSEDTIVLSTDKQLFFFLPGTTPLLSWVQPYRFIREYLPLSGKNWIGIPFGLFLSDRGLKSNSGQVITAQNVLSGKPVFGLLLLDNFIWVATENGIDRYSLNGRKMPPLQFMNELENEVIYSLLSDSYNRIWFSSNKGIGFIPSSRDRIIWFNLRNNLQSLEFNNNASLKNPEGLLYFGGINGVNGIDPQSFNPILPAPDVQLISLYVSDTAFSSGITPENPDIDISWKSSNISGKVFITNYRNNGMQLFSFFLEGYDKKWSIASANASFSYRNLPPGNYRLIVKCTDDQKNLSGAKCLLTISINPPFWKTWWFIVFLSLFTIAISAYIARKVQEFRYKNKLRELERRNAIDKERLRISKDMHDEVGASLTRISILSELAKKQQNEPAKAQQLVDQISEISGNVVDEMSEIIWAMNPRNDTLDSFASYVRQYSSTYLESAGIDGKFSFPDEIPSLSMSSELRRNLFLVIKEALHNIVKHSGAEQVNLNLCFDHNIISIEITDNGKGFIPGTKNGTGNGLINMRKRMEDIDGHFEISSETGKGSKIKLSVSLLMKADSH